jgi:hypothetical protein
MGAYYHVYLSPKPGVTPEQVEKTMNMAVDWFRHKPTYWILYTTSDAKKWYSRLQPLVEPGGQVYICKLDRSDSWGFMPKQFWEWLGKPRNK